MSPEHFSFNLKTIESFAKDLLAIGDAPPPAPRWDQDWFPRLDAAAAYAIVRTRRPQRIIEVGSGHSTRFLARAVADGGLATRITAIDPRPRASISGLKIEFIGNAVQQARKEVFSELQAGDILFIDSSHQLKPGSDVEYLVEKVIPMLVPGVQVHFHDIFLPDAYPPEWAWRRYNEQDAVAGLIGKKLLSVEFSSHQARDNLPGVLAGLPLVSGAHEASLWLSRN